jgi:hypothetical protein
LQHYPQQQQQQNGNKKSSLIEERKKKEKRVQRIKKDLESHNNKTHLLAVFLLSFRAHACANLCWWYCCCACCIIIIIDCFFNDDGFFFSDSANKKLLAPKTKTLNEKTKGTGSVEIFEKSNLAKNNATQEEKESRKRVNIINLVVVVIEGV